MFRRSTVVLTLVMITVMLFVVNAQAASFGDRTLLFGNKGQDVIELQQRLKQEGYYQGAIDGAYGLGTQQAVIDFQIDHQLTIDGIARAQTIQKLKSVSTPNHYWVQPGDSLYKIASKLDTSIQQLKEVNNLTSDYIYPGKRLEVPQAKVANKTISIASTSNESINNSSYYQVQAGDSLYKIANKLDTSIQQLKEVNDLTSDYIYPGKRLKVPQARVTNKTINDTSSYTRLDVSEEELNLLTRAVYSEARGESYIGQVAVASVILNRVEDSRFPDTVKGVIFQPWAFTAVHDGQFWLEPDETAKKAVHDALKGWDPSEGAVFYYNPVKVTSHWIYTREIIKKIGEHYFAS
ncbi:hypothetical protein JCM16358_07210 [Halanaerocella petrolearia]